MCNLEIKADFHIVKILSAYTEVQLEASLRVLMH